MRNFKNRENELIWESFMNKRLGNSMEEELMDKDPYVEDDYDGGIEIKNNSDEPISVIELDTGSDMETSEGCNEVIYSDVKKLAEYSQRILDICKEKELEPWMQAKLVKASDYVSDIWHRLDAEADFANTGFEQSDNISL